MTQFLFSYSPIAVLVPHQQAFHLLGIKFLVHRGCACQQALAFWQFLYVREVLIDKLIISSDNNNENNYFYVLTDSPVHIIHAKRIPYFPPLFTCEQVGIIRFNRYIYRKYIQNLKIQSS